MHSPNQVYPKNSININNSNKSSKVFGNSSNRSSCDEDILIGNLDDLNLINNNNNNNNNTNSSGNKHLTNANSNNTNNIDSLLMHSPSPPHNLLSYVQHQNYSQQLLQLQQNQQQQHLPHSQHQHHHNQQQSYQYQQQQQQQQIPHLSNIPYRKVRPEPIK
jgi:hypothetical protein